MPGPRLVRVAGKNIPGSGTGQGKGRKVSASLGSCWLCTGRPISGLSFSFVERKLRPCQAGVLGGSLGALGAGPGTRFTSCSSLFSPSPRQAIGPAALREKAQHYYTQQVLMD